MVDGSSHFNRTLQKVIGKPSSNPFLHKLSPPGLLQFLNGKTYVGVDLSPVRVPKPYPVSHERVIYQKSHKKLIN